MNRKPKIKTIAIASLLTALIFADRAPAADSAYRTQQMQSSAREGMAGEEVPILKARRVKGGAPLRMAALLKWLGNSTQGLQPSRKPGGDMIAMGADGTYLEVDKDASSIRFRKGNPSHLTACRQTTPWTGAGGEQMPAVGGSNLSELCGVGAPTNMCPCAEPMPMTTLEERGRAIFESLLAEVLQGRSSVDSDEVVFLGSRYLIDEVEEIETGLRQEFVEAHIAIFGREIGGTPVLGAGSKAAISLGPDGELIGLMVDWPEYDTLRKRQATLDIEGIQQRFLENADQPVPVSCLGSGFGESCGDRNLRFECGYIDLGATRRKGSKLQAGCFAQVDGRSEDGRFQVAYSEVMPIGIRVEKDRSWPVTLKLRGRTSKLSDAPCSQRGCQEPETASDS